LGIEEDEQGILASEKEEKQKTFITLQSKEKQLKEDLDRQKKQAVQTDLAIQKLIADEAARAAQKVAAKKTTPKTTGTTTATKEPATGTTSSEKPPAAKAPPTLELTPEARSMGKGFLNNRGTLPWPVAQGSIVGHYGTHPHPVFEKVVVNNNGIDIATTRGASVRAVFEGEITGITNIPGSGWLVIIRHGDYLTVYANLNDIQVKTGDKVKTKQVIGSVLTNAENEDTVLHFEVWKSGSGKMNPEEWIIRREG
jgi:murein DD-endopeptidase MepM/ murein hydrolase activator NlpD